MFYAIYKITNKINGKYYIGKHQTNNLDDGYMGSGILIKRAIKKYGPSNFDKEILFIFDNAEDMNMKEIELVTIDLVEDGYCYNSGVGGQGGPHFKGRQHSEQTKEVLREKSSGKTASLETREKISLSNKNRVVSKYTRKLISNKKIGSSNSTDNNTKISQSLKEYYVSGEVSVYERTQDIKKKTSDSMKKYHLSKSADEKKLSEEHKNKISQSVKEAGVINENVKKKVICPHCNKEGQELAMKRYHFDNCKKK